LSNGIEPASPTTLGDRARPPATRRPSSWRGSSPRRMPRVRSPSRLQRDAISVGIACIEHLGSGDRLADLRHLYTFGNESFSLTSGIPHEKGWVRLTQTPFTPLDWVERQNTLACREGRPARTLMTYVQAECVAIEPDRPVHVTDVQHDFHQLHMKPTKRSDWGGTSCLRRCQQDECPCPPGHQAPTSPSCPNPPPARRGLACR
jgi:hypothetical protein